MKAMMPNTRKIMNARKTMYSIHHEVSVVAKIESSFVEYIVKQCMRHHILIQ